MRRGVPAQNTSVKHVITLIATTISSFSDLKIDSEQVSQ